MIDPTDGDVGRRVRWQGRNPFGELKGFNDTHAVVLFDYEHDVMSIARTDLYWADHNLGKIQTGETGKKKALGRHPRSAFRNNPPGRWED